MKKVIKLIVILFFGMFCITAICLYLNPLRRSEETIRKSLLKDMPIGSDIEEVREYIANHKKWKNRGDKGGYPGWLMGEPLDDGVHTYFRVYMGGYYTPFHAGVSAYWKFDENYKLFELVVNKVYDVP